MAQERYFIGPGLRDKLRETITRVDGMMDRQRGVKSQIVHQEMMPRSGDKVFRICTYTGAWAVDEFKTVTFKNQTATPNTVSAINLFLTLPSNGPRNCAIAKDGTAWHLIQWQQDAATALSSVSLGTATLEFTRVNVISLGTASTVAVSVTTCSTAAG
jgi:hypothetical protein